MYKQFINLENNQIIYSTELATGFSETLKPGYYELLYSGYPEYKVLLSNAKVKINDDIINTNSKYINDIVYKFTDKDSNEKLKQCGIDNRFGILLYGEAGTGKSSIINNIISKLDNCLCFTLFNKDEESIKPIWDFISNIRKSQNNHIVIILDEFDEYLRKSESIIKQIMDGMYSLDNVLFLMSTNYINDIPSTIKDRPSRCKYKIKMEGIQNRETIRKLIKCLNLNEKDENKTINKLEGKTIDEIKNHIIDVLLEINEYKCINEIEKIGFKTQK